MTVSPSLALLLPQRPPSALCWRGRTLHLLDIENLVLGEVTPENVRQVWATYARAIGINDGDQVRVACANTTAARIAFNIPQGPQLIVGGAGPDAADRALIDSIDSAFTAGRFSTVIIGSADHGFAPLAAELATLGCAVHAVHRGTCAAALALSTTRQVRLP